MKLKNVEHQTFQKAYQIQLKLYIPEVDNFYIKFTFSINFQLDWFSVLHLFDFDRYT